MVDGDDWSKASATVAQRNTEANPVRHF